MAAPTDRNLIAVFLVIAIVCGYFASIALITFATISDSRLAQVIGLITAIQNAFMLIVGYYFGSSSGSKAKSETINEMAGTGDGTGTTTTKAKTVTEKTVTVDTTTAAIPAWLTATPYKLGDLVTVGTSKYRALADHTSAVTDEPGVGNDWSGIWERQA